MSLGRMILIVEEIRSRWANAMKCLPYSDFKADLGVGLGLIIIPTDD